MQKQSSIILGIDPGTIVMGYGIIADRSGRPLMLSMGVKRLGSIKDHHARLQAILETVKELIHQHKPTEFAIEAPFFGKNVQSMLKLGRAQGVAIAAAMEAGLPVTEYSPKKVKQAVSGNGNADKEQIWKMLERIFVLDKKPKFYDATDALAVALCHFYKFQSPLPSSTKTSKGWEDFIRNNPDRVKGKQG